MAKYINVDALGIGKARRDVFNDPAYADGWNSAVEIMQNAPAADVTEVRHGRWIADKEDVEWGNYFIRYRCSECKERPHFSKDRYTFIRSPYCPNCGAKMDEREEEK